jgi:hypothetical protein
MLERPVQLRLGLIEMTRARCVRPAAKSQRGFAARAVTVPAPAAATLRPLAGTPFK